MTVVRIETVQRSSECVVVEQSVLRIDPNRTHVSTGCGNGASSVAGVEAIGVDGSLLSGTVGMVAGSGIGIAAVGNNVQISASSPPATLLRNLDDVAIATDAEGNPIVADGSVLRYETFAGSALGVWIASTSLDGGGYTT